MTRPPLPPFTEDTAAQKVRAAEDAWNGRDPAKVALAYTSDSQWRNRNEFLHGRPQIEVFLTRKWEKEIEYRLIKELWIFAENRIAVSLVSNPTEGVITTPTREIGNASISGVVEPCRCTRTGKGPWGRCASCRKGRHGIRAVSSSA